MFTAILMGIMALSDPALIAIAAVAGLLVGAVIVVAAPLLVAHRLPEPPPRAPLSALIPLAGAWLSGWRPVRTVLTALVTAGVFAGLAHFYGQSQKGRLACAYFTLLIAVGYVEVARW